MTGKIAIFVKAGNSRGRAFLLAALVAAPLAASLPVNAGGAGDLQQFMDCKAIPLDAKRLACFDAAATALAAREVVEKSPDQDNSQAKKTVEESFGRESLTPEQRGEEKEAEKYRAKVEVFSRDGYGNLILVLENGQVWRQTDGSEAQILNGEQWVTLHRAAMGSYLITIESIHRAYRFKRVK
jgi:hypothetical protein